jgi:hypothetical protein
MNTSLKFPADFDRSQVWAEAVRLVGEVRKLRRGEPPYDILSSDERAEQLEQLAPDPQDVAPLKFGDVRRWSDEALVDLIAVPAPDQEDLAGEAAAELERRLEGVQRRVALEREEIEDRISAEEAEKLEQDHDYVD